MQTTILETSLFIKKEAAFVRAADEICQKHKVVPPVGCTRNIRITLL